MIFLVEFLSVLLLLMKYKYGRSQSYHAWSVIEKSDCESVLMHTVFNTQVCSIFVEIKELLTSL